MPYISDLVKDSNIARAEDEEYIDSITALLLDRIETLSDYKDHAHYFFQDPFSVTNDSISSTAIKIKSCAQK